MATCESCGRRLPRERAEAEGWFVADVFAEHPPHFLCDRCRTPTEVIRFTFKWAQQPYGVALPEEVFDGAARGAYDYGFFHVRYIWDTDENGTFLEMHITNRFSSDRWQRIHGSGEVVDLPVPSEFKRVSVDAAEQARIEETYRAEWREYGDALRERGLRD